MKAESRQGDARDWAPPYDAQLWLEAERQPGRKLDVIARFAVLQLAAQPLEPRHVIACLETDADATGRRTDIESEGAEREWIRLGARSRNVAQIVRPGAAAERGERPRGDRRAGRQIVQPSLDAEIVLIQIDFGARQGRLVLAWRPSERAEHGKVRVEVVGRLSANENGVLEDITLVARGNQRAYDGPNVEGKRGRRLRFGAQCERGQRGDGDERNAVSQGAWAKRGRTTHGRGIGIDAARHLM